MGAGASAGGGRATRALRLLLLLVMALAAVEYLFGSILNASPLRTYVYTPLYNATQPTLRNAERTPASLNVSNNVMRRPMDLNMTRTKSVEDLNNSARNETTPIPMCESMSDLGPVTVNTTNMEVDDVEKKFPEVQWGGRYTPPNCTAKHKVAIIVPYRDRQQHLPIFLNHMIPFLMKQQIEYKIYIVEQTGSKQLNRAKLKNVGYMESKKMEPGGFPCFIFHDIDLLPLDSRNLYYCTRQPRHMCVCLVKNKSQLLYNSGVFGGVLAMTLEQINTVNGFSNKYWGWGGEDDDMYYRLRKNNYHIARYKMSIARYANLYHKKSTPNPIRFQLLSQTGKTFGRDGLSTLTYEIVQVVQYHLYTHILANIDERS